MKDTPSAPVIEARDLNLVFQTGDGPVHALKDVNLSINRGEFVSFIGPSGCGKTTSLRATAALETPMGGRSTVNGLKRHAAWRTKTKARDFTAPRRVVRWGSWRVGFR